MLKLLYLLIITMLSQTVSDFILHIYKNKFVTKKTQKFFWGMGYYSMVWRLRDDGIAFEDGVTQNNEKIWKLTKKGLDIAKLLFERQTLENKIDGLLKAEVK